MTNDEHLAVEAAQYAQHVVDLADLLAERMASMPAAVAEALLEHALARLAVGVKQLEATSGTPEIAARLGYILSAVIRTRVEELLKER